MRLLIILAVFIGLSWARNKKPPMELAQDISNANTNKDVPLINWGLTGSVTQEMWDRYTVETDSPPTFSHANLNGAGKPTTVIGKTMQTIYNRTVYAFQGIYFGEDTSNYRFKKTQPIGKYWDGDTLEANHLGFKCPQHAMFGPVPSGDEHCLNLNVYTPYMPQDKKTLPVMLFIHGGAFMGGDSSLYLPTKLLDNDVILVTIHYRLGNLGWFSLDNDDAPGNAGLWDQIEALKWVQDNIEGFGGNKSQVTIFGESAGSASVNWLILLPETEGLFHGVIGESGSALEHWSHDPDPIGSAIAVGEYFGCPNYEDIDELYDCMLNMPADEMVMKMSSFVSEDRSNGQMGFRGVAPVTQSESVTEGRLIAKLPIDYFYDGDVKDIPLMIGANKHEGSFVLGIMYTAFLIPNEHLEDSQYIQYGMLDDLLNCFGVNDDTHGISESLQDAYCFGLDVSDFNNSSPGYVDLAGVFFMKAGCWRTAKLHANNSKTSGTFYYSFDFESDDTMFRWLFMGADPMPFRPGVTHADELMYLFSFPAVIEDHQEIVMQRMVRMWTNFATYGNPTPDEDQDKLTELGLPKWKSVTEEELNFYLIQDECSSEVEYPMRWHIALQEDGIGMITLPTRPEATVDPDLPTLNEYNEIDDQRQAYMITMIVFIIVSVLLGGALGYFKFIKK